MAEVSKGRGMRFATRCLYGGVLLLVPTLAILFFGGTVLAALRSDNAAGGPWLDVRSFLPVTKSQPLPATGRTAGAEDEDIEVRLTEWENTGNGITPPR
jgi:hypothetical protein